MILTTLMLVALSAAVLRWSTRHVEAAAERVADLDTEGWRTSAHSLQDAGDELRDAMALREHR